MEVSLLIIILSLLTNAVLSCVEMAFVSTSRSEIRRLAAKGAVDAQRLLRLRDNPERTLSVLQVGITLVGALSAAVGGAGAEETLAPILEQRFGLIEPTSEIVAVLIVVVPITYLSVVIGELVPKTLALRNPLKLSLMSSRYLLIFDRILSPIVFVLERSTKLFLKLIPQNANRATKEEAPPVDMEALPPVQREYVVNMVQLNQKNLAQILHPWKEVDTISDTLTVDEVKAAALSSGHTRLPVLRDNTVLGILHTKEFMVYVNAGGMDWHTLIRPALRVSTNDSVPAVLRLLQKSRNHMAIVNSPDPRVGTLGIVTLEGIFEEIIGDIYDEDDDGRLGRMLLSNPRFKDFYRLNRDSQKN